MKRIAIAIIAMICSVIGFSSPANALPTVSFTYDAVQVAGSVHVYDASASICDGPPCSYKWRYFRTTGTDRLGTTLSKSTSPIISAAIFEPAGKTFKVVLTVTNSNGTNGASSLTQVVALVAPAPVATPLARAALKIGGPSTFSHQSPDLGFDKPLTVRCRNNKATVKVKAGQTSAQKCPGNGGVDRLITGAHQIVRCKSGIVKFDFGAGTTHIIRSAQGPYSGCKSIFKP